MTTILKINSSISNECLMGTEVIECKLNLCSQMPQKWFPIPEKLFPNLKLILSANFYRNTFINKIQKILQVSSKHSVLFTQNIK